MLTTNWDALSKRERYRLLFHGIAAASVSKGARDLLHTLFEYNHRNELFTVSRLAGFMGVSDRTAYRHLASLRRQGIELPASSSYELGKILINRPQLSLLRELCPGQYDAENCDRCDADLHSYCDDVKAFVYRYLEAFEYVWPDEDELCVIHTLHDRYDAYDLCEQLRLLGQSVRATPSSLSPTLKFVESMVQRGIIATNDLGNIANLLSDHPAMWTDCAKLSILSEDLAEARAVYAGGQATIAALDRISCIVNI